MRLIDADALPFERYGKDVISWYATGWNDAINVIDRAPTVDAVPVVRCKDCIHRIRESWAKCTGRRPDEFCSDGERRFKDAVE